jgi:hypothetical protein
MATGFMGYVLPFGQIIFIQNNFSKEWILYLLITGNDFFYKIDITSQKRFPPMRFLGRVVFA